MTPNKLTPKNKVIAGGLGGALSVMLVWAISTYGNVEMPEHVVASLTTVLSLVVAYLTPEGN